MVDLVVINLGSSNKTQAGNTTFFPYVCVCFYFYFMHYSLKLNTEQYYCENQVSHVAKLTYVLILY